jgi:hypothetical protein
MNKKNKKNNICYKEEKRKIELYKKEIFLPFLVGLICHGVTQQKEQHLSHEHSIMHPPKFSLEP